MPYLNLDLDYFTHPKTMRLIGLLGQGAEILPVRLWCHAGKHHAKDGVLEAYEPREIEAIVGWKGEQGAFVSAMVRVGFLTENGHGYALHEWIDHEGHLVMFKERAQRAAFKRWGVKRATSNAKAQAKQSPKQCPLPNHTVPTIPTEPTKDIAASPPKPVSPHVQFVLGFKTTYEAMTGQKFKATDKEYTLAASLIREYGLETCVSKVQVLGELCRDKSAWFTKEGWSAFTIPKLSEKWNEILPIKPQPTKEENLKAELAKWRR